MAKIDWAKYGIAGADERSSTILRYELLFEKRLSLLTKVMKLGKESELELLML